MQYRDLPANALLIDGQDPDVLVYRATSFLARGRGLLFAPQLGDSEALWIAPCNSIHTVGMRYGIDVVFLDRAGRVVAQRKALAPGRWAGCRRAASVLELRAGGADRLGIRDGATLRVEAA